jgi:hypothetical protein
MFLGIPLPLIGFICFIIAAIFIFVRPKSKSEDSFLNGYILHWFHPLAWVLFGTAAFYHKASGILGIILLIVGLGIYGTFLARFAASRK